jgi:hypothetical protein
LLGVAVLFTAATAWADPARHRPGEEASCHAVEQAARANQLSIAVLTRLLWTESRFRPDAVSRVGAQGVAQFMPGTADERGLADPFDPRQAIPEAARLVADLARQFGNIGLAIAAYNAGPNRVGRWLQSAAALPQETRVFVLAVTGRSADDWAVSQRTGHDPARAELQSCVELRSLLREFRGDGAIAQRGLALRGLERSGLVLPSLRQSGRLLPGAQQSGRVLPQMAHSGRLLPKAAAYRR